MSKEKSLKTPEGKSLTIDELLESNSVLTSQMKELEEDCQRQVEEYKLESDEVSKVNIELKKEIEDLRAKIEMLEKKSDFSSTHSIIMDVKKLDPKKKYVTGPEGKGFVEAK